MCCYEGRGGDSDVSDDVYGGDCHDCGDVMMFGDCGDFCDVCGDVMFGVVILVMFVVMRGNFGIVPWCGG